MKCIDGLKKIGIDKISAKTRITQDKVQNIIDCKYEAFDKTRARGFVQIIEREFGIDLSEWFEAYSDYHNIKKAEREKSEITPNSPNNDVSESIIIQTDSDKKDKSYIVLVLLLIVLVAVFAGFFAYNNFIAPSDSKGANQTALTPLQEIQRQNKRDLAREDFAQSDAFPSDSANPNENSENSKNVDLGGGDSQESKVSQDSKEAMNPNAIQSETQGAFQNTNQSAIQSDSANQNANLDAIQSATPRDSLTQELIITPNEPLWVGIIDLKTRRKKQLSIDARHNITLTNDKIIRTGHSYFSVSLGANFAKQYIGGDNKYFLYRVEGGLKEISKAEFLELNRGEEW